MRFALVLLLAVCGGCAASPPLAPEAPWPAERPDPALQAEVEEIARGFRGRVGVYVRHLPTGRSAVVNGDSLFPTASMIKIPILVATMDAIERGDLAWDQSLVFRDSLRYDTHGLVGLLRDSARIELQQAVVEMISASDNNASLWLQALSGGGTRINEILSARGYTGTRMNSRTEGRRADWQRYGWGQTTPREMARLMREIVDADVDVVSPEADGRMHRVLTRTFLDEEALASIPPGVQVASKQGAVSASRSEVLYVHAPSGPYVFAVITAEQEDTSWEPSNEGYVLLRDISRLFWSTFEPESLWRPDSPPSAR